ncbi:MAG TPA: biopolymer transporter ExbB [Verrucomicrobia bacterium]|nr:biopolymer transporter ExbB [Verrucomicrobiota bacterium]
MGIFNLISLGGAVAWCIVASGVAALYVFIERSLSLHRARIRYSDFLSGMFNVLGKGNIKEALALCDETPGPVAYLVKVAILYRDAEKEDLYRTLRDAAAAEISRMERRLVVITTVAQVAPLLGLFGTILGILQGAITLQSQGPLVQSANLLDGLLISLATTAIGLGVAIPCYAAFNLLVIKIDRIVLDMERTRYEIVSFLKGVRRQEES